VLLWIPAVRRMRGDDRDPRHPLRVRAQRPH
jgi:hypothetical protein